MITKQQLLRVLVNLKIEQIQRYDPEVSHQVADEALLNYIDDKEIYDAYKALTRWFA